MSGVVRVVLVVVAIVAGSACRKAKPKEDKSKSLETLGYLTSAPMSDEESALDGVTVLEPKAVAPGITVVCQLSASFCNFVDISGKVVFTIHPAGTGLGVIAPKLHDDGVALEEERGDGAFVLKDYDATDFMFLLGGRGVVHRMDSSGRIKWTAGLPVIHVVFKNNGYACVADGQRAFFGGEYATRFGGGDFAKLAQSLGCDGYSPKTYSELAEATRSALERRRPCVIEIDVDPDDTIFNYYHPIVLEYYRKLGTR